MTTGTKEFVIKEKKSTGESCVIRAELGIFRFFFRGKNCKTEKICCFKKGTVLTHTALVASKVLSFHKLCLVEASDKTGEIVERTLPTD